MADYIPVPAVVPSDEEESISPPTLSSPPVTNLPCHQHADTTEVIESEEEDPEEVEFELGEESTDSDPTPYMLPPSPPIHRRTHSNVFMPHVSLEHIQNLAFAYVNPPHPSPQAMIRRALLTGAGNPQVALRASSQGAGLVVFGSAYERELSVLSSPFNCPFNSVHLVRHDDTENRFLFDLGTVCALNLEDFPIEYWFPDTITHSVVPFACPILIDPVCLTGVDYSAVLISVKSRSINDIPHSIAVHGFSGLGAIASVMVVRSETLPPDSTFPVASGSDDSSNGGGGDDFGDSGADFSSGLDYELAPPPPPPASDMHHQDGVVQLPGGRTMMANHKPLVAAVPLDARPVTVDVKLFSGFYDVRIVGRNGERGFYRIPMRPVGSPRLLVANLASCSIGYLNRVGTVGSSRKPLTDVEVICSDDHGYHHGQVISGEREVLRAFGRFDSDQPLLPLGPPTPPLLLQAASATSDIAAPLDPTSAAVPLLEPAPTATDKSTVVYCRRSARLRKSEQASRLSMLEKATMLKKQRLDGKTPASTDGLLPAKELLLLAAAGTPPLARRDVLQFAEACDVSEFDLNKVAPECVDV
uniref:Uncharacterized protein n=1 Tax=Hordeum vulgare subsp. vulgare TaxID=112509 RepID=A0A8I6WKR3_HORVV